MKKEIYGDWVLHCSTHVELLRLRSLYHPERRAYTFLADGEKEATHLTFAELDRQARVIAALLQERQASGQPVLLLYQPGLEYLAAFFGCLYAGAIAVPAYPPRLNHNLERLEAIVADAHPALALSSETVATTTMRKHFTAFSHLGALAIEVTNALPERLADQWRDPHVSGETLAFLQYTSGSTGKPKGVMVTHQNLLYNHRMFQEALQHPSDAPFVSWLPLFHDMGLIGNALQSVYLGSTCVLMSPFSFLQKPLRWLHAISSYRAYSSFAPNFAYDHCLQKITPEQRAMLDLSHWHNAVNAAEPIRNETVERFVEAFAPCGFRRDAFFLGYGLAEATLFVSSARPGQDPVAQTVQADALEQNSVLAPTSKEQRTRTLVNCGHTWLEQKIVVADPETHVVCSSEQVGEIWISGPNIVQGYWRRPEATRETFQARLTGSEEGPFLRTGDLGFLNQGNLFVTGRLKDLIIIYGQNYYPQDIEAIAEKSHLALRPNCNAAFSLDVGGEERVILVQEIERQYRHQEPKDVFAAIRQAVFEEHDLHIHGIVLIKPGSIPKTSSGKIQRRACREALLKHDLSIVFADLPQSLAHLLGTSTDEQQEENSALAQSKQDMLQAAPSAAVVLASGLIASSRAISGRQEKNMQFSLLYFASDEAALGGNKYELLLEGAKFADQHDFTAIWIPERHFHPFGGLYPNPSVLAAALAVTTQKIRLRAGSVVLPMHHLARVAEEWSVVDNLSEGRVDLAFATGWNPNDFVLAPENYAARKEHLFAGIETFDKLWRGEAVTWPNGVGQQKETRIYPQPRQRELTHWITCTGNPERFVEAGAMGANVLTGLLFQSVEELAEKIKLYREARASHGHDPESGHVTLMLHTFVDEELEEVRRKVRAPFTAYLESSVDLWRHGKDKLDGLTEQEREQVLSYAFERYFQTHALFGTPQSCEKMVERLTLAGVDEIASLIDFGLDIDTVMDGLHWLNVLRKRSQRRDRSQKREPVRSTASVNTAPRQSNVAKKEEAPTLAPRTSVASLSPEREWPREIVSQLASASQEQCKQFLQAYLRQQIAQVLERSYEELAEIANMRSLGLDSLKVMSVVNNCQRDLHIQLDAGQFYELTSFEDLTLYLVGEYDRVHGREQSVSHASRVSLTMQRQERSISFPQSFAQQRMWFLSQLQPNTVAYNVPMAVRIHGDVDVEALRQSLEEIVRRHESLRTTFDIQQEEPVQIINPPTIFPLLVVRRQRDELQQLAMEEAHAPFDLAQGPLLRATLLIVDEVESLLLLTYHHIVADGWSRGILMRELQTLYSSFVAGQPSPLAELSIQYADFAVWQREWLQRQVADESEGTLLVHQLAYWKEQLAEPLPVLDLPTDRPRPPLQTFRGAHLPIQLSEQLMQDLKAFSEREGVSLFMTLLASFQLLLARYSGQEDILVGSPIAGRTRAETEALIGFFVNTLVLRTDLSGNPTFRELLQRVRSVCLDAYAHQEVPFEQVVEAVYPARDLSRSPLFQVMLVLNDASWWVEAEVADLQFSQVEMESGIAAFDLTWSVTNRGFGVVEYNTDLFDESTITRLLSHWYTLLHAIVADPQQVIATVPLLSAAEQQQILVGWNETKQTYRQSLCLHQLFEEHARLAPTAIALKTPTESLSYQEVERRSNQLAHALVRQGITPAARVGVCMLRGPEAIISLLAILKAGAVYVPLDPYYPQERLAFMMKDAQISLLLTQERVLAGLSEQEVPVLCIEPSWFQQSSESTERLARESTPDRLAYIIYTSGSTGLPKGVQVSHQGIQNLMEVQKAQFALQADDQILQFSSLSFDASIWEVCMSLGTGATLCLAAEESVLAGSVLKEALERLAITVVTLPPSVLSSLPSDGLSQLRTIIVAGEACSSELVAQWATGRRFFNAYGPTESTVCATMERCEDATATVTIGRPIANTQIYILDAAMQPVPVGVAGEIYIGGVILAYGYLNQPALTAERFVPDPFSGWSGERLYRTGDRGHYQADGRIAFLGRVDHQAKIRGYRIEPGEIEAVLLQHPTVRECVVIVQEMQAEEKRLIAYLVLQEGSAFSIEEIRAHLRQRLPEYMVPAILQAIEAMPLTPNGKIDRKRLPDAGVVRQQEEGARVLPANASEQIIADIWQEYLHLEKIGRNENFFDLGGHSLLAVQVLHRLQDHFQRDIALTDVFKYTTISTFARYLDQFDQKMQFIQEQNVALQARQEEALIVGKNRLKKMRLAMNERVK